jgi:hypothetical protein
MESEDEDVQAALSPKSVAPAVLLLPEELGLNARGDAHGFDPRQYPASTICTKNLTDGIAFVLS